MIRCLAVSCLVAAFACGPSSAEIERAKSARYTCQFDQVFGAVVNAIRAEQPPVGFADPAKGEIVSQPRWHDPSGLRKKAGAAVVNDGDMAFAVSATVAAAEEGGFRVTAEPHVYAYVPGMSQNDPIERGDADWPGWADVKIDRLLVDIHGRLESCAVTTARR